MKEQESHCLKITDKSIIFQRCLNFRAKNFTIAKIDFTVVKTDFIVVKTNFTVVKKYFQTLCLESSSLTLTVHSSVAWSCYVGNYQRSQLHESAKKYMLDVISLVKKL